MPQRRTLHSVTWIYVIFTSNRVLGLMVTVCDNDNKCYIFLNVQLCLVIKLRFSVHACPSWNTRTYSVCILVEYIVVCLPYEELL